MKRTNFIRYSILGQVILWLILLAMGVSYELAIIDFWPALVISLNFVVLTMIVVYIHYFMLLPLLFRRKYLQYVVFTLITLGTGIFLYLTFDTLMPFDYPMEESLWSSSAYSFFSLILFIALSSMYYYINKWYLHREKQEVLQTEKLRTELNFLRSQINPHFLFNTLNNIYSYAQTGNEKTAPMLEKLAGILRFMVYECDQNTVELNKEIEAIENLLEIHRMKNSAQTNIVFEYKGVKGYHLVAPLILVNLVENACKHSNAVSDLNGFIRLNAEVNEQHLLHFKVSNSIKQKTDSTTLSPGGLGLKNIVKRLDLLYGNTYAMKDANDGKVYQLELEIPLTVKNAEYI
ncbi:sensor histidine kinase [Aureisphaera galaxeae]|uniref:sensor histidine kinase n=1 Tax=Aureisphaera galaxeae TaxID=1538023 RepID=UPI00234FF62C|nr:sensor histidine kinase [Aureisphaera galaxeae]MDC8004561.1 sensor histidine kinase [Aureisphaera galaxeae]